MLKRRRILPPPQERVEDENDDEEEPRERVEGENDEEVVEGGDQVDGPHELPEEVAELGELEVAGQEGDDAQAGEAEDEQEVVVKEEEEEEEAEEQEVEENEDEAQAGEVDADEGGGGMPVSDDWSDWSSRDPVLTLSFESKLLLDSGFKCNKVALHCLSHII